MTQPPEQDYDPEATLYASPGKRKAFVRPALQAEAATRSAEDRDLELDALTGLNPLVAAANPLLALVPQLRNAPAHPDPAGLRETLLRQLAEFDRVAQGLGLPPEYVTGARYALCTVLDEAVMSTPWGAAAQWARTSLLVTRFNETWGGEKFFQLLSSMAGDPQRHLPLLELLYVCLVLGFEGRYRVVEGGKAKLDEVRERLYEMIRKQRGPAETGLSPNWRGLRVPMRRGVRLLPFWVTASVAALVLAAVFIYLVVALNERSDAVFATLASLRVPVARMPAAAAAPAAPKAEPMRLKKLLAEEIRQNLVSVEEDEASSLVTLRGDNLFAKGSAEIEPGYEPVVKRIAEALNSVPGTVVIRGHTDSTPIRTARFPSNWHLSQERAGSVRRLMAGTLTDAGRMKVEGLADTSPVAKNDTADNQARNRRVEVLLRVTAQ